ncbi:MAG TPA: DUF1080 domain-containing protein [Opitutaceae bacterium]|jgi:hypothetical protein|nr:DUF1080 domain-containing protein [Opitutaceae bacterium]
MKLRTPLWFILPLLAASAGLAADDSWRPLFNGRDFSGWESYLGVPPASVQIPGAERDASGSYLKPLGINHDPLHAFSVVEADGRPAIRLSGAVQGGLTTVESFGNYHLRLQFKWGEKRKDQRATESRNSGFLYHAYGEPGAVKGRWMSSHQFQIKEGRTGDYIAMGDAVASIHARSADGKNFTNDETADAVTFGNKEVAGPNCAMPGKDYENPSGEWNTIEVICLGDTCIQVVNGHVTLRIAASRRLAEKIQAPLTEGRLELDMEGWEIYFRDIEIRPIKEIPAEYAAH